MDWIKLEVATPDKVEVFAIAEAVGIAPTDALGRLILVWRWFDQHTECGNAGSVSDAFLDHVAGMPGIAKAMRDVGWLADDPRRKGMLYLPNFDRHNGKTAKSRALTAERVQTYKQRSANGKVTEPALPREDKKRSNPISPNAAFAAFWLAYPKKVSKGQAERAWAKIGPDEQLVERILHAVERASASADWCKEGGQYIPHPSTWLSGKRWEDELAPAHGGGAQQLKVAI